MLSFVVRGFLLLLCGCQVQKPSESVTQILETVETLCKDHRLPEAIDYLTHKDIYKNLDLLETLAFLYEGNNEWLLSAQTFEQLSYADIDKQYIECAFHAAEIYHQLGDIYSAGRCYRLYLDLNPKDYFIWFKLSAIEEQLEHPTMALTAYFNGIDAAAIDIGMHSKKLSELCYLNHMLEAAEFWGQMALKEQPQEPSILEILLKIADAHNDRHKATNYILKLKALKPDFLEKHPDLHTKYIYEDVTQDTFTQPIDIIIPHDIHSTSTEIENTLQLITPHLIYYRSSTIKIQLPLCPNSIY